MNLIIWAIAVIIFIILEIVTIQLVSVWLAGGALITMLAVLFSEISVTGQLILFALSSCILLAVTFPLAKKIRNRKHIPTNSELNVGKQAIVTEEINTHTGTGRVSLDGIYWKAVSDEIIPINSTVTVIAIEGTTL
ncbi:MAG: NfeD family protein, partial [Ruminococcus sp.]|nr:NfeD family protein [Ruminococcus sp.]